MVTPPVLVSLDESGVFGGRSGGKVAERCARPDPLVDSFCIAGLDGRRNAFCRFSEALGEDANDGPIRNLSMSSSCIPDVSGVEPLSASWETANSASCGVSSS